MQHEIIVGRIPVREALRAKRRRAHRLYLQERARDLREIENAASGIPVEHRPKHDLDRIAQGVAHQGVVLEANPTPILELEPWLAKVPDNAIVILLDSIEDPQNFGAIVRSAAAFGAAGVIFAKDRAAPVSTAMIKASAGGVEYVDLIRVTNLARSMGTLKDAGFWITGLAGESEQTLWQTDLSGDTAIVIGNEGKGLRTLIRERCDHLAAIPMTGPISSLNASVSAAIALSECARQRDA